MNQYVTGSVIKNLREKKKLTQSELAQALAVSDKAVSKWETGKGYPDITMLEPLSKSLGVSVTELLAGETVENTNLSANMLRSKFYICPICGNVICSTGETVINCHGLQLSPEEEDPCDDRHNMLIKKTEDEYYIKIDHEMTKQHNISFAAAISPSRIQFEKFYPEQDAETRFKIGGVSRIYFYCNRDGLFYKEAF